MAWQEKKGEGVWIHRDG